MIRSLIRLINSFSKKLNTDNVSAFSAQAAFFLIISFFPFFMFLLTLLNYLPFSKPELLSAIESVFPQTVAVYLSDILDEVREKSNGTVLSLTAIATLWTSSKGFYAVVRGLDSIYHSTGWLLLQFQRLRQHPELQPSHCPADDTGVPAVLDHQFPHRRIPL